MGVVPAADAPAWAALHALLSLEALVELAVLAGCLLLAWAVVRAARPAATPSDSIWFGHRNIDGVLFPALALLAALLARWALKAWLPIALFHLAVPILFSLLVIRIAVRVLRAAFPSSKSVRVLERTLSWFVWIGMVLWVTGLLPLLLSEMEAITWSMGGASVSLRSLVEGVLNAGAVLLGALWLSSTIESRLLAGADKYGRDSISVRKIMANGVRALLLVVGLMMAMSAAGIPLGALSVLGGAVGVGIGLGMQKLAANYVSGFVILAERSLRIGDLVKVDNFEGRITDIHTRYTVIRAPGGREAIVPNEMMLTQRVENASFGDSSLSLNTVVQVAYGSDLETVLPRLVQAVAKVPRVMPAPAPAVLLNNFAADGLDLFVSFWISDPENGQGNVRSDVNLTILRTLKELGIEIPFPQRVMHTIPAPNAEAHFDGSAAR
ncbi:MAG TPA: mechanosensitive ion channel domain-containing protein [Rubrivivax sp.]